MIHLSCDERYEKLLGQHLDLEQSLAEHKAMVAILETRNASLSGMVGDLSNTIHDLMLWFDASTVRQEQAKEDA